MFPDSDSTTLNIEESIDNASSSAGLNAIQKEVKDFSQLAPSKNAFNNKQSNDAAASELRKQNSNTGFLTIIKMIHLLMLLLRKNQLNHSLRTIVKTTVEQGNVIDNLSSSTSTSANNPLNKALVLASKF